MTINLLTRVLVPFITGLLSFAAHAEEEKPAAWSADLGMGFVKTTGNTKTTTVKGDIEAVNEIKKIAPHSERRGAEYFRWLPR
jgi:hypothetical protein